MPTLPTMPSTPATAHVKLGAILGMEQIAVLHVTLLDTLASERLVLDFEGCDRLHGAAFQLLATLIRDRAAAQMTTDIANVSPAIETLLALAGLPVSPSPASKEAAA